MKHSVTQLALPSSPPRTILAAHRWHQSLLRACIELEFRRKAIEAALLKLNEEFSHYVPHVRDEAGLHGPAKLALEALNQLKREFNAELESVKHSVDVLHDTNEFIIGNLIVAHGGREFVDAATKPPVLKSTNLLHGDGWMLEVLSASRLLNEGKLGFVTFGTSFDPSGFDVIAFSHPRRRIRWKCRWPKTKRSTKRRVA